MKVSDDSRDISNYGILVGGDFGLLENKIKLGTSFMFDSTNLEDSYRESIINSLILSLYSKYDIFELPNRDKLFVYGVISYAYSWENEQAEIDNFNNKSNKYANIIALDVLSSYRFNNIGVTPKFGFNFISGSRNNYYDKLG